VWILLWVAPWKIFLSMLSYCYLVLCMWPKDQRRVQRVSVCVRSFPKFDPVRSCLNWTLHYNQYMFFDAAFAFTLAKVREYWSCSVLWMSWILQELHNGSYFQVCYLTIIKFLCTWSNNQGCVQLLSDPTRSFPKFDPVRAHLNWTLGSTLTGSKMAAANDSTKWHSSWA